MAQVQRPSEGLPEGGLRRAEAGVAGAHRNAEMPRHVGHGSALHEGHPEDIAMDLRELGDSLPHQRQPLLFLPVVFGGSSRDEARCRRERQGTALGPPLRAPLRHDMPGDPVEERANIQPRPAAPVRLEQDLLGEVFAPVGRIHPEAMEQRADISCMPLVDRIQWWQRLQGRPGWVRGGEGVIAAGHDALSRSAKNAARRRVDRSRARSRSHATRMSTRARRQ